MRYVFDRELQRVIPKDIRELPLRERKAWASEQDKNKKPFVPCAPRVISDDLGKDGIINHADGRRYDSKSSYYSAVKAAGCEVVGNDRFDPPKSVDRTGNLEADVATAFAEHGH